MDDHQKQEDSKETSLESMQRKGESKNSEKQDGGKVSGMKVQVPESVARASKHLRDRKRDKKEPPSPARSNVSEQLSEEEPPRTPAGHKNFIARKKNHGDGSSSPGVAAEAASPPAIADNPGAFAVEGETVQRQNKGMVVSPLVSSGGQENAEEIPEEQVSLKPNKSEDIDKVEIATGVGLVDGSRHSSHHDSETMLSGAGRFTEPDYEEDVVESTNGLAVAHAIDEEQGAVVSAPVAIEYDPDAKIPIYKKPRFKIYFAVGCLVLVAIIVGVVVGVVVGGDNDGPAGPPTPAPTTVRDAAIVEQFQALVGDEVIQKGTPAFKAAEWILNEDPMALSESADNLDQRFLLAYFYFFTTQKSEWRTCGKPEEGEGADCMFDLLTFDRESDTESYIPVPATRWLSGETECKWQGALCDSLGIVGGIEIGGNNMTGPLPPMLAKFPMMESITLFSSEFTGSIPEEYADIKLLRYLELDNNLLTGTISPSFSKATDLEVFNVGGNALTGSINGNETFTLASLTELREFHIFDNVITGDFPTELGALKFLVSAKCQNNDFEMQPLPSELGNLASLEELWIDGNSFTSTIPTEFGLATKLTDLRLNANLLEGTIPEELFGLVNLKLLFLEKNMLDGTLSPSVGQLIKLEQIRLRENQLAGAIPSELGSLPNLFLVFLHRNLFTGPVPQELCNNVSCEGLEFLNADCGGLNPANPCPCCTSCCEQGFGIESCFQTNFLTCN